MEALIDGDKKHIFLVDLELGNQSLSKPLCSEAAALKVHGRPCACARTVAGSNTCTAHHAEIPSNIASHYRFVLYRSHSNSLTTAPSISACSFDPYPN